MRACLDACVLYPTVMREVLLGACRAGLLEPVWSDRILEEWRRAAARRGEDPAFVGGEIAALRALWPEAEVTPAALNVVLPDPDDEHVLGAAVAGEAQILVTLNLKDFPTRVLAGQGIVRRDPDGLCAELLVEEPEAMGVVAGSVLARANIGTGRTWTARDLYRKARMPRFGKAAEGIV